MTATQVEVDKTCGYVHGEEYAMSSSLPSRRRSTRPSTSPPSDGALVVVTAIVPLLALAMLAIATWAT